MAATGRRADLIAEHGDIAERVRKLEVMRQSRVLVPKPWTPNRDELDAIAGHLIMLSTFEGGIGHDVGTTFPVHVGPAAQYLWAIHDQESYQHEGVAADWTRYLQFMGAVPGTTAADPFEMGESPFPGAAFSPPNTVRGWQGGPTGLHKILCYWGIPPRGSWQHFNAGSAPILGGPSDFNDGGLVRFDGTEVISPGGLLGSFGGGDTSNPIVARDNTYGFTTPRDCGGPNEPLYNGYTYPGIPVLYDSGPEPCPDGDAIGAVFNAGGIYRYRMWLPDLDVLLLTPPKPRYGLVDPWRDTSGLTFPGWGGSTFPGVSVLMEAIAEHLPSFPHVQAFYDRTMPYALAQQRVERHFNHLSLRLHPAWRGRVEVQIHDQMALLRGTVQASLETLVNAPNIAIWPVGYGGAWSSDHFSYLLPETAETTGARPTMEGHLGDGTAVPLNLQTRIDGVRYFIIDGPFAAAWSAAHATPGHAQDISITFDGATFALEWP